MSLFEPFCAAHANQLIINEIGGHADQGQVPLALANDLMAGGVRDQVGEPFQRNRIAILDEFRHRILQGHEARQRGPQRG